MAAGIGAAARITGALHQASTMADHAGKHGLQGLFLVAEVAMPQAAHQLVKVVPANAHQVLMVA
jgi:hypothetical protein